MGALTNTEKFKIQEMYLAGTDENEIATKLSRGETIVANYIKGFKEKIQGIIPNIEQEIKTEAEQKQKEKKEKLSKAIAAAKKRLKSQLTDEQIKTRLSHIMSQAKYPKNEEDIYQRVLSYKPFIENIGRMTEGNHSGRVAVFTEAASELADHHKKSTRSSRLTKGACFPAKKEEK